MILSFSLPEFPERIKQGIKIHTIRKDNPGRWKPGRKIHFWKGSPRSTRAKEKPYPFGIGVISDIKLIEIDTNINMIQIRPLDYSFIKNICVLSHLNLFAIQDGFDSWEEMKLFFGTQIFKGKLLSWDYFKCEWF